jgi:hypothetical protein
LIWWTGLLGDDRALTRVLELLEDGAADLEAQYLTAARDALDDASLGPLAVELYRLALDAFGRLPADYQSSETQRAFEVFGERFTLARRTPADELIERVARDGLSRTTIGNLGREWCGLVDPQTCAGNRGLPVIGDG